MTAETAVQEPTTTRAQWVRIILAGIGFGLLLGGMLLGLYSRFLAATVPLDDWGFRSAGVVGTPERFAVAAVVAGAVALLLTAIAFRRGRESGGYDEFEGQYEVLATLVIIVIVLTLVIMVMASHLPSMVDYLRTQYPYFSRLTTAITATGLVGVGSVLVLGLTPRVSVVWRIDRRIVAVAVAAGLVIAATAAFAAVRAGDDDANFDHTTAGTADIPAIPGRLGSERYRVEIPANENPDIVAAGTGFVVATQAGLTAYDGRSGRERWHYLRTRQNGRLAMGYASGSLLAVEGDVVVAAWSNLGYRAFDATTGELLWTETDFNRDTGSVGWAWMVGGKSSEYLSGPLTLGNPTQIARYDARTGARLWLTDTRSPECPGPTRDSWNGNVPDIRTDTAVYRIQQCSDGTQSWWQILALDADTGTITATRAVGQGALENDPLPAITQRLANTVVVQLRKPDPDSYLLIDSPAHLASAPIRRTGSPIGADPSGPQVALDIHAPQNVMQTVDANSDTAATLTIPDPHLRDPYANRVVYLHNEIVAISQQKSGGSYQQSVRSWSRTDGSPASTQPIENATRYCGSTRLVPTASALVLICGADTPERAPTVIIGYAPEP
ncbi:PQQ-binding-like beta-propeller repeat protein [Nocardia sp. NBC_00511]|uniref:outer membrane protein assembly factor BamB family protein n=1 Tax=Nocardia sp. NBC_00511 TaxID=2903591 RepID=UPI0030DEBE32